tara:strand:- start:8603 stop:9136 length:534 start_codon:yes stop_codon:yes gene_type:complete
MNTVIAYLSFVFGMFIGALIVVYTYMFIFVTWLGYDYVTASSIYFALIVFGIALPTIIQMAKNSRTAVTSGIIGLGIYPLVFAGAMTLYETWSSPFISDHINIVAAYRSLIAWPLTMLSNAVASLGPMASATVGQIEGSPVLSQLTALAGTGLVHQIYQSLTRKKTEPQPVPQPRRG